MSAVRVLRSPRRLAWAAVAAAAVWCGAMLAAPLVLAPGTVTGLAGRENHVDHLDLWLSLPPVPALVYGVGDVLCHQKDWRSFHLNGNALPVDERMTAIFLAGAAALVVAALRGAASPYLTDAVRPMLPRALDARLPAARARAAWALTGLVALALVPAAVDVAWENLLGRESTTALRVATGALAGVAGGLVLGAWALAADAFARIVYAASVAPRVARRWPRAEAALAPWFAR